MIINNLFSCESGRNEIEKVKFVAKLSAHELPSENVSGKSIISYFGYTTDFLLTRGTSPKKWILVGAPTSQDKFQSSLNQPGALFKCDPFGTSSSCEQIMIGRGGNVEDRDYDKVQIYHGKDKGWLGASLAVGDAVLVCAPRWQNDIEKLENQTPLSHMNGICYEIPRVLDPSLVDKYAFLSKDKDQRTLNETHYYYHYMNGMMGLSRKTTCILEMIIKDLC
ncbi:ITGA9 [Mytilus coruscus]|uniref:ITGA9 n=1 Tax=Mytilus coruscus TaxID=42192 RepID=A0A6J8DKV5_MYTCO|nr:ITGA9 [Mytilus coruscus]